VARVSGKSFRDFTDESIFRPLGMTRTHFHGDHQEIVKNRAYSYARDGKGGFRKSVLSYANVGATSLFTTAEDLAKWLLNFEIQAVGGPDMIRQMHERFVLNNGETIPYAFGLRTSEYRGLRRVAHSGSDAGYRSYCGRFPDQRFGVVILSNVANLVTEAMAMKVADIYLDDRFTGQAREEGLPRTGAEPPQYGPACPGLDSYCGRYLVEMEGTVISVAQEATGLMIQVPGKPVASLEHDAGHKFRVPALDASIAFETDQAGSVTRCSIDLPSGPVRAQPVTARRIPEMSVSQALLAEYAGDYYSEELGTVYTIAYEDGNLMLRHRRIDDAVLIPMGEDLFQAQSRGTGEFRFSREGSRVTGFRLSVYRARNLRFVRTT
jgi:hypothetical protein